MHSPDNEQRHYLSESRVLERWSSNQSFGLDPAEAEARLSLHGPNTITTHHSQSPFVRFLLQFHQSLIYILLVSGIIAAILHEWVDSAVIFGVILANAPVGYIQEAKAVDALAALAKNMASEATVLRKGIKTRLDAVQVVPGPYSLSASSPTSGSLATPASCCSSSLAVHTSPS